MTSHEFKCIHDECLNEECSNSYVSDKLRYYLGKNPNAVNERDDYGGTLLHYAVIGCRTIEYCKILMDLNAELVKTPDSDQRLPIHYACENQGNIIEANRADNMELIKFLFQSYPESINVPDSEGYYLIHQCLDSGDVQLELLQFLLKHDQGAVTKPDNSGDLPLHLVSRMGFMDGNDTFEAVFNAYPEAIYSKNDDGDTPLDAVQQLLDVHFDDDSDDADDDIDYFIELRMSFLENQLELAQLAQQVIIPDRTGKLPIHRVLQKMNPALGSIKLMTAANPASLSVADNEGMVPLHVACQCDNDVDVVEFLMKADRESLNVSDLKGNLALHHACLAGNCDVVSCILKESKLGASLQNILGMLPIQILLYHSICDRDSEEYTEAIYHLLRAHPGALAELVE